MSFGEDFERDFSFETGDPNPELLARAEGIEGLANELLAKPDWEQTQLHYQVPLGSNHRLELLARRTSGHPLYPESERNFYVYQQGNQEGYVVAPIIVDLDKAAETGEVKWPFDEDTIAPLLEEIGGNESNQVEIGMIQNAVAMRRDGVNQGNFDSFTLGFAELLSKGVVNERKLFEHTLEDGTIVRVMTNTKEGDQPWDEIDTEPELRVRVHISGKVIGFRHERDGSFETYDNDSSDNARVIASAIGDNNVIDTGDKVIAFNNGDLNTRLAALAEAERAMGLRTLRDDRLSVVKDALKKALEEKNGQSQ